ncbi:MULTISPECIES: hypothetical protein [unclassified Streptomyces]|jgi:hypothetical protein|uniref:hypothetical protein n=1 Tax=unclassified Streptomyces TaxID=2593676 RepID=UPI0036B5F6D2
MAEKTDDLSVQITDLRKYLTKSDEGLLPTTTWMKEQLAPVNKLIEELKAQQEKVAEEVVKAPWEKVMEELGLGSVAEMIKKFQEEGLVAALGASLVALGSIIVPILLTALGAFLVFQLQKWHAGRNNNQTFGPRPDGSFGRRDFTDIQNERNGVPPGGLADIPADANFDGLRKQLRLLNPKIEKFNALAPDFVTNFRELPSERAMTKAATGVGKVADAVEKVKPDDVDKLATAVGKLAVSQENFNPRKLPKARGLASAATEAERLAKAGDAVKLAFENLKAAAQSAERVIAAT